MKFQSIIIVNLIVLMSTANLLARKPNDRTVTSEEKGTPAIVSDSSAINVDSTGNKKSSEITHKVIAYYFHGTKRCGSCKRLEAYSQEAIESGFAEELKTGKMEWFIINTDKPENRHYTKDYQLYTVISSIENGKQTKWKNLDKIWQLLRNKEDFIRYVQKETRTFLEIE